MDIPFTINNAKAVGVLVLTISVIMLYMSGRDGIVGFLLFLPGGIAALRYNEEKDKEKKRRKAFAILLDILDRVDTIYGWNERLHKLHHVLKKYEDDLPYDVRNQIDSVANKTDIQNLRNYLFSQAPNPRKQSHKVAKILAATIGGSVPIYGIALASASSWQFNQPSTHSVSISSHHPTPHHQVEEHHKKHHAETPPPTTPPPIVG